MLFRSSRKTAGKGVMANQPASTQSADKVPGTPEAPAAKDANKDAGKGAADKGAAPSDAKTDAKAADKGDKGSKAGDVPK